MNMEKPSLKKWLGPAAMATLGGLFGAKALEQRQLFTDVTPSAISNPEPKTEGEKIGEVSLTKAVQEDAK